MATEVTILVMRTLPAMSPERAGQQDTVVAFRVEGSNSPVDHVTIAKANPTEAEVRAAITERLKVRGTLEGKKITL